jgi:hypothetical protein
MSCFSSILISFTFLRNWQNFANSFEVHSSAVNPIPNTGKENPNNVFIDISIIST